MNNRTSTYPRSFTSLQAESISSFIMNKIIESMLEGELKPGDKLPTEAELAKRFCVGRNSVREAMKMLSSIGAVRISRGEGTFISSSISDNMLNPLILSLIFAQGTARELLEIRVLLETAAAELVASKATIQDIEHLQEVNDCLLNGTADTTDNPHELRDRDVAFHKVFYNITGNSLLIKISNAIYALFYASIEKTVIADPKLAYKNHQLIIDALRNGDVDEVCTAIRSSLSYWENYIQPSKSVT